MNTGMRVNVEYGKIVMLGQNNVKFMVRISGGVIVRFRG